MNRTKRVRKLNKLRKALIETNITQGSSKSDAQIKVRDTLTKLDDRRTPLTDDQIIPS